MDLDILRTMVMTVLMWTRALMRSWERKEKGCNKEENDHDANLQWWLLRRAPPWRDLLLRLPENILTRIKEQRWIYDCDDQLGQTVLGWGGANCFCSLLFIVSVYCLLFIFYGLFLTKSTIRWGSSPWWRWSPWKKRRFPRLTRSANFFRLRFGDDNLFLWLLTWQVTTVNTVSQKFFFYQ